MHYPWSHLRRTLSGTLPCEARTFLTWPLSVLPAAITYLTLSKTEHQTVNNLTTNSLSCPSPNRRSHKAIQNSLSHIKAASPHKLPQNRVFRNILNRHPDKIIQELQQPLRFKIFRTVPFNCKQQWLCILFQHSKLIN